MSDGMDWTDRIQQSSDGTSVVVDAQDIPYRALNAKLREMVTEGIREIRLVNVTGQRYIGTNLQEKLKLSIQGVPGNDLGAFMDGPDLHVLGNAQDGCGNTMNSGSITIHGSAGDIAGHSMRGGEILIRDNVGYRVGIHMKEYGDGPWGGTGKPVIVIGGTAQHFLGEYMAGGLLIVLGAQLGKNGMHPSRFVGTGMHGGRMYIRGQVQEAFLGAEVGQAPIEAEDQWLIQRYVTKYGDTFGLDISDLLEGPYLKLVPLTKRPYGRLYAY